MYIPSWTTKSEKRALSTAEKPWSIPFLDADESVRYSDIPTFCSDLSKIGYDCWASICWVILSFTLDGDVIVVTTGGDGDFGDDGGEVLVVMILDIVGTGGFGAIDGDGTAASSILLLSLMFSLFNMNIIMDYIEVPLSDSLWCSVNSEFVGCALYFPLFLVVWMAEQAIVW